MGQKSNDDFCGYGSLDRCDLNKWGQRPIIFHIPYFSFRHSIKPEITGWAQVNYPYGASKKDALEKLQYDLYYIKNMSMFLDFHILLKTVRVMLFRKGAR